MIRKFLTISQKPNNTLRRVLSDEEQLEFIKSSVSWIKGQDIMDTCFILNFGYETPLPWPQVIMRLDDENKGKDLRLVPGSHGQNVPSTCTIVIIAGIFK